MYDTHTARAAILATCGIFFYASGGISLSPEQLAEVLRLLDGDNPLITIPQYLGTLDVPGDDEVVEVDNV